MMRPLLGWLPTVCLVRIYHHCPYLARFCVTGLLVVPAWAFLPFCFWSRGYSVATWWQVGVAWVCISGRRHFASSVCSLPWLGLVALLSLAPFCVMCLPLALTWACGPFVSGHASVAWPSGGFGLHIWTAPFCVVGLPFFSLAVCPFVLGHASMAGLYIGGVGLVWVGMSGCFSFSVCVSF